MLLSMNTYIGSPKLARGVLDRRYIDRSYFAIQQEFRFPVWRRFAATLFHSIGTVESKWSNLFKKDARYIYAYGLGLRYKLTKAERVRLRMDFGLSESQFNFYFTIGEAF